MKFYVKRVSSSKEELKHSDDELQHFGILGMKWGVRRYQNPDGTLTPEGRARYGISDTGEAKIGAEIKNGYFKTKWGKVKAQKNNGFFTEEYKNAARKGAQDENKYNPDFLRKVNGSFIINNREEMLREYNRFLDLTDKYYKKPEDRGITAEKAEEERKERHAANEVVRDVAKEFLTEREMMDLKTQRSIDAAKTGVSVLNKLGWYDDLDPDNRYDLEWFMQEDQTFGLPQVADLANKGYSEKKIEKLIDDATSAYRKSSWREDYPHNEKGVDASGIWYLDMADRVGSEYINACVDYNKKRSK